MERYWLVGGGLRIAGAEIGRRCFGGAIVALEASGNFFWSPSKLVAAVGVRDLVLVDTPDAILLCPWIGLRMWAKS